MHPRRGAAEVGVVRGRTDDPRLTAAAAVPPLSLLRLLLRGRRFDLDNRNPTTMSFRAYKIDLVFLLQARQLN